MNEKITFSDNKIEFKDTWQDRILGGIGMWFFTFIVWALFQNYNFEYMFEVIIANGILLFLALAGGFYLLRSGYGCFDKTNQEFYWAMGWQKFRRKLFIRHFNDIEKIYVHTSKTPKNKTLIYCVWIKFKGNPNILLGHEIELIHTYNKQEARLLVKKLCLFTGTAHLPTDNKL